MPARLLRARSRDKIGPVNGGRIGDGVGLIGFEPCRAMNDPNVIVGVDGNTDGLAEDPMIGQRLRPGEIDLEARRHHAGAVGTENNESDRRQRSAFHVAYYTLLGRNAHQREFLFFRGTIETCHIAAQDSVPNAQLLLQLRA